MRVCLRFVEQKSFESHQNAVKSHLLYRLFSLLFLPVAGYQSWNMSEIIHCRTLLMV